MDRYKLARLIIFLISTFSLLYALFIASISFAGLNITASHLSQPLLIGYGVFWLVVAPSGLWGLFGSIQNNTTLWNRYLKDHWFSSALITTVDIIKIVFSFTMKDNSIRKCSNGVATAISRCRSKVDFDQKAGFIAFGAQEFLLIGLGLLIWFSCKRLTQKKGEKTKAVSEQDLEGQRLHGLNIVSTANDNDGLRENASLETNSPLSENYKGQNEKEPVSNIENPHKIQENDKNLQRSEQKQQQQQQQQKPERPKKSSNRKLSSDKSQTQQRQEPPPQGMNPIFPNIRSGGVKVAPPIGHPNILPFEYRPMQPLQYSQLQTSMVPSFPLHFNGPLPPQFQQLPNFQSSYPWQQQWQQFGDDPRRDSIRGHRRSKSQPQLRPLPVPPMSIQQAPLIRPQIPIIQRQAIPPQIIEKKQQAIPPQTVERQKESSNNNNNYPYTRRASVSSRFKPPIIEQTRPIIEQSRPPIIEQSRPISQIHRANSLPNLYNYEFLMRNGLLSAPPVPVIPQSLQPGNNNNKSNDKDVKESKSKPQTTNDPEKLDRFIKLYGNKEYKMNPQPQYNKYSDIQYNSWNTWNTNENNDYIPQERPRPTSAHSVNGEARPKSSASSSEASEDSIYKYYDDYYYDNIKNQATMNNNYAYAQYMGPMYNGDNGGKFVRNYNGGDNIWVNYGQPRQELIRHYY